MMSGWGFSESPLVDGDRVLCTPGGADAMIVALDKLTGKEIWRSSMPSTGRSRQGRRRLFVDRDFQCLRREAIRAARRPRA